MDTYILKAPSLTQRFEESMLLRRLYGLAEEFFSSETARQKGYFVVDTDIIEGAYCDTPTFWTEKISKAYSGETEGINSSNFLKEVTYRWDEKAKKLKEVI